MFSSCNSSTVSDFMSVSDVTLTFEPDESEKTVTIATIFDNVVEVTEQFTAIISSTSDQVIFTEDRATISIVDTGEG